MSNNNQIERTDNIPDRKEEEEVAHIPAIEKKEQSDRALMTMMPLGILGLGIAGWSYINTMMLSSSAEPRSTNSRHFVKRSVAAAAAGEPGLTCLVHIF